MQQLPTRDLVIKPRISKWTGQCGEFVNWDDIQLSIEILKWMVTLPCPEQLFVFLLASVVDLLRLQATLMSLWREVGLCQGTWPYAYNPRWGWGHRHLTLWQVSFWHADWPCKLLPIIMGIASAFTVMQDPKDQMELNTADFLTSRGRRYRTQLPGARVWLPKTIIPSLWLPAIGNVEESILNRDWTQPCNMHNLRVFFFFFHWDLF